MAYSYETADPILYKLLKDFAKRQRQKPTDAEKVLWEYLKGSQLGQPFRKQHIIGEFIADFICLPAHLIIEVDGGYHQLPEQQVDDETRTQRLNKQGFRVMRFTNEQVLFDTEKVVEEIKKNLKIWNKHM
ncbi:MAG: endonuclease domain-containing protein [Bacteroidaceae bacterium]|nr:endonuclease domain-containing protein [Bacteroidaceae bacterium]